MDIEYRNTLTEAINFLNDMSNELFSKAINVLMYGELKDVNKVFENGDDYDFKMSHLETSKDTNVLLIAKLLREIDQTVNTIGNINNISEDEL